MFFLFFLFFLLEGTKPAAEDAGRGGAGVEGAGSPLPPEAAFMLPNKVDGVACGRAGELKGNT